MSLPHSIRFSFYGSMTSHNYPELNKLEKKRHDLSHRENTGPSQGEWKKLVLCFCLYLGILINDINKIGGAS